ncbi:hypothetical protein ACM61V_12325 [Sphingomonas sp. TX0543]|uniref:hypothetical protein n=1 Tax=unclassified Sphingomonas TaxID=196159 RepID=UPI0014854B9B|nr:hypothetical protein [Sphingomonas sp. 3P27F8]
MIYVPKTPSGRMRPSQIARSLEPKQLKSPRSLLERGCRRRAAASHPACGADGDRQFAHPLATGGRGIGKGKDNGAGGSSKIRRSRIGSVEHTCMTTPFGCATGTQCSPFAAS